MSQIVRQPDLKRSVVKLIVVRRAPNRYQPWELNYQEHSGGSACIVENQQLLTSAHVVSHAVHVHVIRPGDARKYTARVRCIDHDRELAVLTVDEPQFFNEMVPVKMGSLPHLHDTVSVWGFPSSGTELCITSGVVSRIEVLEYTHSCRNLLALQTDAAINPGNSGGPVFLDGAMIGIAFQSHRREQFQNTHYVVPVPVIQAFWDDLADAQISGVPDLGIHWQRIENDSLRSYLQLSGDETGVLISRVLYGGSAYGHLHEGDVLLTVDGISVAGDGTYLFRQDQRVEFTNLLSNRQIGDRRVLSILRGGKRIDLAITLGSYVSLVPPARPGATSTYFILGGFVFQPLSYDYMMTWGWDKVDYRFKYYYYQGLPSDDCKEIVLISQVLAHDVNAGYHQVHGVIVTRVNGRKIREMADLLRAFAEPLGRFHVIETDNLGHRINDYRPCIGSRIVIDANAASLATRDILEQHAISRDRSADLSDAPAQ